MSLVGTATHHSTASATNSVTYSGTSGNSLIVFFSTATAITGLAVSDTAGNTYTNPVALTNGGAGNAYIAAFYVQVEKSSGSNTITANWTTNAAAVLTVAEYQPLGSFDKASGANRATSAAYSTNPATPTNINALAISFVGTNTASTPTFSAPTNGFTQEFQTSPSPNMAFSDLLVATPVSTSSGGTISGSIGWTAILLIFNPSVLISAVSSATANVTGTTGTYTLTESVAVNDLILVQWVPNNVGSAVVPTISDTVNTGNYLEAGTAYYYSTGSHSFGQSYIACNASGIPTLTITAAAMNNCQLLITHFTGFTNIPTLDVIANTSGTAASFTNTITTTKTNELAVSNTFSTTTISSTPSGWNPTHSGGDGDICQTYYQFEPSIGTYSINASLTVSAFYNNWTFSFYSATAGLSIPAAFGSFTMTGIDATFIPGILGAGSGVMLANPGAFDWIGAQANNLGQIYADFGAFTFSGIGVTFFNSQNQAFTLPCATGYFAMTGIDQVLQGPNYLMSEFTGYFALTGFPAILTATGQSVIPPGYEAMPNLVGLDWLGASAVLWYGGFAELQPEIVKGTPLQMAEAIVIGQTPSAYAVVPNGCAVQLSVASSNLVSVSFESH